MGKIQDRIDRQRLEIAARLAAVRAEKFKTAKEFADKHDIPQSTYALHEGGKRGLARSLDIYAELLGVRAEWLRTGHGPQRELNQVPGVDMHSATIPQQTVAIDPIQPLTFEPGRHSTGQRNLRILGHTKAGKQGFFIDQGQTWGFAMRPESLIGIAEAYAVRVHDSSMENRFMPGNVLQVDPFRGPKPGDNVVIQLKDGQAFVKELVRRTDRLVVCRQFNPPESVEYKTSEIQALHFVVGIDYLER